MTLKSAIGERIMLTYPPYEATVVAHTERGFTYRGQPSSFIPRLGMSFTGEGEMFTDVPGWDTQVRCETEIERYGRAFREIDKRT